MSDLVQKLKFFLKQRPKLDKSVYVAKGAIVMGAVTLGPESSVWYNSVLRGDINRIEVGHHTNIQDNAVVHLANDYPCLIGNYVTIGHSAVVHACTIGDDTLIGMGAVVLDGADVGRYCLIGAKALVTPGMQIPDGSLVMGMPAKVVRSLTNQEKDRLHDSAMKYAEYAAYCIQHRVNLAGPHQYGAVWPPIKIRKKKPAQAGRRFARQPQSGD